MAKDSFGNTLFACLDGGSLAEIANLIEFDPPRSSRGMQDVTEINQASQAQEFSPEGTYNPGKLTGRLHYLAGSVADDFFLSVESGGLCDFKVQVKAASGTEDIICSGYVEDYGPDGQTHNGKQTAGFSVQVTGSKTQAPTA